MLWGDVVDKFVLEILFACALSIVSMYIIMHVARAHRIIYKLFET